MKKRFLVCIDSDGCVFDTMEVKHKECFCPAFINYFNLQPVSKYARSAWEFANLYSSYRGIHRLYALLKAMEVLAQHEEVKKRGFQPPELAELHQYVSSGCPLSNAGLESYLETNPQSEEIRNTLEWSVNVNERVAELVHGVPPFPYVRESLEKLKECADIVIVSATQQLAVEREWKENNLLSFVTAVMGQESGTKKEIIASLKEQYESGHVLMIGDAPGDRDAAKANGALFYPICPGEETQSWRKFAECMDAFFNDRYAGEMEDKNIAYFETLLPSRPFWEMTPGKREDK